MSVEGGGDSPKMREHIKKRVDQGFSDGRKLYGDSYNEFGWLIAYVDIDSVQMIPPNYLPLKHYEEYIRAHSPQDELDYVMQLSDPEAVAAYNKFIDELNADLERIIKEKDVTALEAFLERGSTLVYKKE